MYLLAGGGVVYGREDETNSKVPMAYAMLEAIARRLPHLKPVSFYIDLRASGSKIPMGINTSSMSGYDRIGSAMETQHQQQSANSKKSTSVPEQKQ